MKRIKFQPMNDLVVIEKDKVKEKTSGGIILTNPKGQQEDPAYGHIVAVGSKVTDVNIGDRVMFSIFGGSPLDFEGQLYILMSELEIMGVMDEVE